MAIHKTFNKKGRKQIPRYLNFSRKITFFTGIESLMNISGDFYRIKNDLSDTSSDSRAIKKDWSLVGGDLRNAINSFRIYG